MSNETKQAVPASAVAHGSEAKERLRAELRKAGTFGVRWERDEIRICFNTPNRLKLYRALLAFAEESDLPPNNQAQPRAGHQDHE